MKARLALALAAALSFAPLAARAARADDPKLTPEQVKAQKKEKDLAKAHKDLDKELTSKKAAPEFIQAADGFLDKLALQINLDVKPSVDFVHKVMAKKIPWDEAVTNADATLRAAVDKKTMKIDMAKFTTDFTKWISTWKPAPAAAAGSPSPPAKSAPSPSK